jgi:hypothetical protein
MVKFLQLCLQCLQAKKDLLLYRDKGAKMATPYSIGHGMRRRNGTPSNSLEAAGKSMTRNHQTSDEAYQNAISAGSARIPLGALTPSTFAGNLMPKKNTQSGDPVDPGSKGPRRTPVLNVGGERLGAAYTVKAGLGASIDPSAGATMANAKIVPSVMGRQAPNFYAGEQASMF